jgi:hypothetical protein
LLPIKKFKLTKKGDPYRSCNSCIQKKRGEKKEQDISVRGPNKRTLENRILVKSHKKRCGICGIIKELEEFHKHKSRVGGVCDECRECACNRNKRRYAAARFGPERLASFRQHSRHLNLPFNLTEEDLERLWEKQEGMCFYSKIPMVFTIGCYNTVSVDRKNSNKGYVMDNLVLCCDKINVMKGEGSYELLFNICKSVINNPIDVDVYPDLKEGKKYGHGGRSRNSHRENKF